MTKQKQAKLEARVMELSGQVATLRRLASAALEEAESMLPAPEFTPACSALRDLMMNLSAADEASKEGV